MGRGKNGGERRTLVGSITGRDQFSVVRFDERLADGEAEAQTAQLAAGALLERVKNLRQRFRIDPHSGIGNFHPQLVLAVLGPDFEPAAFRRKLHRVLDQVPKNLLEPGRVGLERSFRGGEIGPEREIFFLDVRLTNLKGAAQEQVRVHFFQVQLHLAFADSRQIEQVIDQPRFQLDVAPDHLERGPQFVRQILGLLERKDGR